MQIWGFGGHKRLLTWLWHLDIDLDMVIGLQYTNDPFLTSSAWLRLAQRSSVPKFDSDLFCLEKLIRWDWLREA